MFHEQFEHQNVAHSMENERFSLKNAANTVDMAASSSKMLQIAPKCCKLEDIRGSNSKKNSWKGTFLLQNAANNKENGQNRKSQNGGKDNSGPLIFPHLNGLSGFIIPGLTAKYLVDSWMRIFNQVTIFTVFVLFKKDLWTTWGSSKIRTFFCE